MGILLGTTKGTKIKHKDTKITKHTKKIWFSL